MKLLRRLSVIILCAFCLGAVQRAPLVAAPVQLEGEAARDFLAEQGMLAQIAEDMNSAPPQGRTYGEIDIASASDGASFDGFGYSVALDGDTALVGAYAADVNGNFDQGAAYVFVRQGASWSQQQKLVASDGVQGDFFGYSVALDGDTALIGAAQANVNGNFDQGAAYVFVREGASWSQQQKLVASDGVADDRFGRSVALDGDTALIGADQADVNGNFYQGAAYVFVRQGASWSQQQKLVASDGAQGDRFGWSVALDGETALVGASLADVGGNASQGTAYVFVREGASWSQQQKLVASDGAARDRFGWSVALDGETALVGAYWADAGGNANQGAAYVFLREGASWEPAAEARRQRRCGG